MSELPELQLGPLADLQRRMTKLEDEVEHLIESIEILIEMQTKDDQ